MNSTSTSPLFSPLRLGAFSLAHRVVMVGKPASIKPPGSYPPAQLAMDYFAPRATDGGLVICCTGSPRSMVPTAPSWCHLETASEVNGWRQVTDAIHTSGGLAIAQICGAAFATETAMESTSDLDGVLEAVRNTAENASDAGFDGVELLVPYFQPESHPRHSSLTGDAHGYWAQEVLETVTVAWPNKRVGVCMPRPTGTQNVATCLDLLVRLRRFDIAFVHLVNPRRNAPTPPGNSQEVSQAIRAASGAQLLVSGGYDAATATSVLDLGEADAVGFGKAFRDPLWLGRIRLGDFHASFESQELARR